MTSPTTNKEPLKKDSPEIEEPKKKYNFFKSTYDELKLVVWPNKQQLFSESVAVILWYLFLQQPLHLSADSMDGQPRKFLVELSLNIH